MIVKNRSFAEFEDFINDLISQDNRDKKRDNPHMTEGESEYWRYVMSKDCPAVYNDFDDMQEGFFCMRDHFTGEPFLTTKDEGIARAIGLKEHYKYMEG